MARPSLSNPFSAAELATTGSRVLRRKEVGRGGAEGTHGHDLRGRWLSEYGDGDGVFWRAMAAFLGGGCAAQPALQARRGATARNRPEGRSAKRDGLADAVGGRRENWAAVRVAAGVVSGCLGSAVGSGGVVSFPIGVLWLSGSTACLAHCIRDDQEFP